MCRLLHGLSGTLLMAFLVVSRVYEKSSILPGENTGAHNFFSAGSATLPLGSLEAGQQLGTLSDPNNEVNITLYLVAVAVVDPAGGLEGRYDKRVFFRSGRAGFFRGYHFSHKSRVGGLHRGVY